tara:strand:- start:558 stop:722 length:165 start_codon:yes stop_codon:yes gene_type:complete
LKGINPAKDKKVCFQEEIGEYSNNPNMVLEHSKQVKILEKLLIDRLFTKNIKRV